MVHVVPLSVVIDTQPAWVLVSADANHASNFRRKSLLLVTALVMLVYRVIVAVEFRRKKHPLFETPSDVLQYGVPVTTHPRVFVTAVPLYVTLLKSSENTGSPTHTGGCGSGGVKVPSVT